MRSSDWKDDERLKDSLEEYSRQGLQRQEILSFMKKDFSHYAWSLRTLDRRLRWWRELHERLEKYFKEKLSYLKEQGYYNPDNERDRYMWCI